MPGESGMKKRVDLSVVILNYNTRDMTRTCLKSVFSSRLGRYTMEVIVCDNGSTDGSLDMIRKEFPKVIRIDNKKNLGFAAGNNPGVAASAGRYILLLNTDTEVPPTTLSAVLTFMDRSPQAGAATCTLLLPDGSIDPACHRGFPSPWVALTYVTKFEKLFPKSRVFGEYHQGYKNLHEVHEVDVISGAFFLVRSDVVRQVGRLDEDYFFYGEDMDWCYRIKQAGWKIMYYPEVTILHKKKQSGRAHADRARRRQTAMYFYQYNKLFYKKHYDGKISPVIMALVYFLFDFRIFFLKHIFPE